ncbi:B-box zinc finger protein 22-like isoform X2 [Vigna umbellata]|uniref:B-box zinc finger protein 22-like isoform X2 n=1 Tax=Vigna umbellata TaxID=87088 RepID=UPI001F5F2A84|nr:B-box zinc finger protein 22-like isoform X2 [Vigna umbellata]
MKIQCNVCEAAEAKVLCCADEAALCLECDEKVHAANKLATKHQRVPLSLSASHVPKCDICQRFLLTGVRVGLEATEPGASSSSVKSQSGEKTSDAKSSSISRNVSSMPQPPNFNEVFPSEMGGVEDFPPNKVSYGGGYTAGNISQWPMEEFLGLNEFSQYYNYMDGSSKADSGKLGDSDSSVLRSSEEEIDDDGFLGRVPDSSWTVPQIPSPPTASGLHCPELRRYTSDNAMFVPDICFSGERRQPRRVLHHSIHSKRRRNL